MNIRQPSKAFFAVKRRNLDAKLAPTLVAIVESYDAAIRLADRKNNSVQTEQYYATVHHG